MIRIVLVGENPASWNKYWAGVHWTKRKADRDRIHLLVREQIDPETAKMFDVPVHIHINVWFKNKVVQLDAQNICNKPYIDALQGWYIEDDGPDHVPYFTSASFIDRRRPRLEIEIHPLEQPPF